MMNDKLLNDASVSMANGGGLDERRPRDTGFFPEKWEMGIEGAEEAHENARMESSTLIPDLPRAVK